ncbi:sulfatase [Halosquirtibacter laminarini]|uniref:Sulfatase n=1 Tax=Halosquirtibacter laminarini TaxID=3374600 RepID=A0AC61NH98_9BACT|nr:sulfatase [Prolixibacteraceae bacterium]
MKLKDISLSMAMMLSASCFHHAEAQSEEKSPNILFISVDDLNDWVGLMGDKEHPDVITPNLDRLAARGVYFTNNHANTTACTPSRLSVMTGMGAVSTGCYTNSSGVQNKSLFQESIPLQSTLRQSGYYTMGCGKIEGHALMEYDKKYPDTKMWDERVPRSFRMNTPTFRDGGGYGGIDFYPFPMGGSDIKKYNASYKGHSLCAGPIDRDYIPGGKMPDELTVEWAMDRLQKDYEKPFMLGVGFVRPHVPYTAPREFFDMYPLDKIHIPVDPKGEMDDIPLFGKAMAYGCFDPCDERMVRELGPEYRKKLVQGYLACVTFMDTQLGKLLDALDKSVYADNTIICLWSDHGQHLGEKHSWRKQDLWQESTNCPMLWIVPGVTKGGKVCNQPTSLIDIYPTMLSLCGLESKHALDGNGLLPQLKNVKVKRDYPALTSWSFGSHSLRGVRYHYIHYYDGSEELYDCKKDYAEHTNLASNPKYAKVIERMKKFLPKDKYQPTERSKEFHRY